MPARELFEAFNFTVSVEGFPEEGFHFASCSELAFSQERIGFREAGAIVPVNDPGFVEYDPVTLTRGASRNRMLYDWAIGAALAGPVFNSAGYVRREVQVIQRGRALASNGRSREIIQVYTLHRAFPTKFVAGEWDNNSDAVVIQSMTLAYDYFTLKVRKHADQRLATGL